MSPNIEETLERISKVFTENKLTLAVAESCTGGLLGHTITQVPGCSVWFLGGVISYSNEVKETLLDVFKETLIEYGAVSGEVALEMACGVRLKLGSDVSIAITGIAGPNGGTAKKPVGLVFIALDFDEKTGKEPLVKKLQLRGTRTEIKEQTVHEVLTTLFEAFS
jgi:PncC family amidohydrolase